MEIETEHQKALDKAKITLMTLRDTVFLTTVLFSLSHIWDEKIPTACTNGKYIRYNPDFFMKLTPEERLFLLLHETLHVALLHMLRRGKRQAGLWNAAADYVINAFLIKHGFKMPAMGLYDSAFIDMGVEEVYDLLLAKQENIQVPWDDLVEPETEENSGLEREVEDILIRAQIQASSSGKGIGNLPGDLQIYLDNLLNPKLPWRKILKNHCTEAAKVHYTFQRPNRRFFPKYYLPTLNGTGLNSFAMFADASGSVTDEEFSQIISETANIFRLLNPASITIGEFDTGIKSVKKVKSLNELRGVQFHGRGGTAIYPVLEWAVENKPKLLLIFTDGFFRFPDPLPKPGRTKIIWLIHNNKNFTAPYGKVIHYEIGT